MGKVRQLIKTAKVSIGVEYGLLSAKLRLNLLLDELEMIERHISEIESSMEQMLCATGYAEQILSIKGIGIVTAAGRLATRLGSIMRVRLSIMQGITLLRTVQVRVRAERAYQSGAEVSFGVCCIR